MTPDQAIITNCQQLRLNEPLKAIEFLVRTMGFEPMPSGCEREVLIQDDQGNCFRLPLTPGINAREPVLLYTHDCLNTYFDLKATSDVPVLNHPQYTPQGLMLEFMDNWGNFYKILEKRFYED